jgi:hypothetical protein
LNQVGPSRPDAVDPSGLVQAAAKTDESEGSRESHDKQIE